MNFRQRLALLMVVVYLGLSFGVLYYIFEISEHYNNFALEHVEKFHPEKKTDTKKADNTLSSSHSSFWHHMMAIPMSVWLLVLILPYLQIFFMLLACTRSEPRLSIAYTWPGLVYLKYQQYIKRLPWQQSKPINSTVILNGHSVLDT